MRCFLAVEVVKVKVIETVALALEHKLPVVPRQENERILRLHVLGVLLLEQLAEAFARNSVVSHEFHVVLVAVKLENINGFLIGRPAYVGKVTVCRVGGLQVNRLSRKHVEHTYVHLVARLAGHRVFDRCEFCYARHAGRVLAIVGAQRRYIHQRIVCNHALVHFVERKTVSLRAPERTFAYAELISVH